MAKKTATKKPATKKATKKSPAKKPAPKKAKTSAKKKTTKTKSTAKTEAIPSAEQLMVQLEELGTEQGRKHYRKHGCHDNQFGVKLGDIRKIAKAIKVNHELALSLWQTENVDARFLAILIMNIKELSSTDVEQLTQSLAFSRVADWLISYIVKKHPDKESLRQKWMKSGSGMTTRAAWSLTSERLAKAPEGLDIKGLLDRLEKELGDAPELEQWTMNEALANIGIHAPKFRKRAIDIGERLGVYRDYPTSKGCTSPFAPIWIDAMVKRQK